MALSGTYTWNLDVGEIIEEAYDRCRLELRSGYDLATARRSLNLVLTSWISKGVNLWTLDQFTVSMVDGTYSYTLDSQVVDVLDAIYRISGGNDVPMARISIEEYLNQPDKDAESGVVSQFAVERNATGGHTLHIWPAPDNSNDSIVYWGIRYIQDLDTTYTDNVDIPRRFLPALTLGLAYELSYKHRARVIQQDGKTLEVDGVDAATRESIKKDYMQAFDEARREDRDRASFRITPWRRA